jgi:hypothetical protein
MFTRHRTCEVRCQLPGSVHPTSFRGRMVWFQPRMTSRGFIVRFGVLLEGNEDEPLNDIRAYIKELEKKELESGAIYPTDPMQAPPPPDRE